MKIENITIGFELECGIYRYENQSIMSDTDFFDDICGDGSLRSSGDMVEMVEGRTIPFDYNNLIWRLYLKKMSGFQDEGIIGFNRSCGLHFHFRIADRASVSFALNNAELQEKWLEMIKEKYPKLYRARYKNSYCEVDAIGSGSRYQPINMGALLKSGRTIECRFYGCYENDRIDFNEYRHFITDTVQFYAQAYRKEKNISLAYDQACDTHYYNSIII